jgi:type I site-specific deoxyribonuclease S subunit, restriction modification system
MTGEIPKHWKIKRLGEIGVFFKGKGVPKDKITDTGFKCLTYGDLYTKYDFVIEGVKSFIDKETALISQEIRYGDICFAGSGETLEDIGKCATFIDDEIGYAGGDIIVFRTEQNPIVMSYLLNSDIAKKQKFSMGQGHSVVHIYSSQLEKLKLPFPPLEEQEKIAEILLTCDKAIRLTTQIINQLKQRNQGLSQQLLTGEKNWKKSVLKNIAKIKKGEQLNVLNLNNKYKYPSYSGGITPSGYTDKYNTEKDTIIISEGGNSCGYINFIQENFWSGGHCYSIVNSSISKDINKMFLFYFLKKNQEEIMRLRVGSGLPNIQKRDIELFEIEYPPLANQNAIAQILDTVHQELKLYEQKLQLLQAQKKTLMQKLLTGEVLTIKK